MTDAYTYLAAWIHLFLVVDTWQGPEYTAAIAHRIKTLAAIRFQTRSLQKDRNKHPVELEAYEREDSFESVKKTFKPIKDHISDSGNNYCDDKVLKDFDNKKRGGNHQAAYQDDPSVLEKLLRHIKKVRNKNNDHELP